MEELRKDDLQVIWGTKAIGAVINRTERQTYYLLTTGKIPGRKIGEQWTTTRGELRKALAGADVA